MFGFASKKKPRQDAITAFLGAGAQYRGQFNFQGVARVDGGVVGDIVSDGMLVLGEEGLIQGSVNVGELVASGRVLGDVTASRRVVLNKTAEIRGDLRTPSVIIEDGAVLNGRLRMTEPEAVMLPQQEIPTCALTGEDVAETTS